MKVYNKKKKGGFIQTESLVRSKMLKNKNIKYKKILIISIN